MDMEQQQFPPLADADAWRGVLEALDDPRLVMAYLAEWGYAFYYSTHDPGAVVAWRPAGQPPTIFRLCDEWRSRIAQQIEADTAEQRRHAHQVGEFLSVQVRLPSVA